MKKALRIVFFVVTLICYISVLISPEHIWLMGFFSLAIPDVLSAPLDGYSGLAMRGDGHPYEVDAVHGFIRGLRGHEAHVRCNNLKWVGWHPKLTQIRFFLCYSDPRWCQPPTNT